MPGPIDKNFELFTEASHFTDDTVCTIAFASAILAKEANKIPPFKGALIYWCKKYPLAGYGERFED